MFASGAALGQPNSDFNVTVNVGPVAPNSDTVFPGEATSLRVTLSNNNTVTSLTGVGYSIPLPTNAANGLRVNGASSINGVAGCVGTLTTAIGAPGISLSGLTVPPRQVGVAGSGECYLDIPIAAYSVDGNSTSLSYNVPAGAVSSNQGVNATGGPQAYTVRLAQRPTWSKDFVANNVLVIGGATRTLRITITNPEPAVGLTGIAFTDVFPTFPVLGGPAIMEPVGTPAGGTCGGNVALTQGDSAQIAVSNVSLAGGTSCTIDVAVRGRLTGGVYNRTGTNTIPATGFTSAQGLRPSSNATRNVQVRSPLAITKNFNPGIIAAGQPNSFNITLTNNGSVALPVTSFTDNPIAAAPYQARMNIASTAAISNSCGGSSALVGGGQGFNVSGFSIPANGNCQINVTYTAQTPGSDEPTTYTNDIPEGAVQTSVAGIVSQARSATVLVADRLRVIKARYPFSAAPGNPVRHDVTIQNFSASALSNVSVTDLLQNGSTLLLSATYPAGITAGCGTLGLNGATQGAGSVTFTIPNLPARSGTNTPGACTINFWVMMDPNATTSTDNLIGAGNVCFGSPATCNTVPSLPVTTDLLDSMVLAKTFDGQESVSKSEGKRTRMRLQLDNYTINALSSLTFSDTLPTAGPFQQLRVAQPANISNTCGGTVTAVPGTTSVALNTGSVAAYDVDTTTAGTCALEVDVTGPAGVYPNSADAGAVRHNANGTTTPLTASDGATVTYTDALQASKSFSPTTVGPDGKATASIRLVSVDPTRPITGIGFTDNLPAGMLVATPANSYTTCNGPTTLGAVSGTGVVSLSGATLAPLGVCEVRFDVSVTGNTDWTNTIQPGQLQADGGLTNRTPISATLSYVEPAVPLISKAINPGTIVPGQSALLTINLTNGTQALSNLQVTDYFTLDGLVTGANNGMSIAPAPEASTNCPGGILTALPEGNSVRLSGASMAANTQCQVQVRVTSTTVGTLTNTIPLNSITTDQGATNSTSFAQSTLSTTSAIGVGKLFEPPVVSPSEPARLRITIYNTQPQSVTGLSFTDEFPEGLLVAPDPNPYSDCGGSVNVTFPSTSSVAMSGGTVAAAQGMEASTCILETSVVAAVEGTYLNTIPEDTLRANGNPIPHPPANGKLEVRERLIVNKAIDNRTLDAGNPVGFTTGIAVRLPGVPAPLTIRLENPNNTALTQVNFIDTLPDGLVLAQNPALASTCAGAVISGVAAGRDIRMSGATLAATGQAGAICTVTASVVSNIPGLYTNEIPAGDVRSFEGIDNNPGTQAQIGIATSPGLTKDIAPPVIPPAGRATLTIVLENNNLLNATLRAPLVDTLPTAPGPMLVASPNAVTTNCPGGPGRISAPAGSPTVTILQNTSVPPGGCVVTVAVTATVPGDYVNYIPVGALDTNFGFNERDAEAPLKLSTLGYIAGRVFRDNQAVPNGLYIPGSSTPIAGNPVELRSGPDCSGGVLASDTTDAMGNYLFADLAAGTYSVCQPTQPPATLNSITLPGVIIPYAGSTGTAGTASNPPGAIPTSQIVNIVLNNNGNADQVSGSPENNFSEVRPASIAGNVYYDRNNDGLFDAGEDGIGGVTVTLTGPVNTSTVTNADGSYSFTDLPPGTYTVTETQPGAWTDGMDTLGTVYGSPRGNGSANDTFSAIVLNPGDPGIAYNFGEILVDGALALEASAYCENDAPRVAYSIPSFTGPGAGSAPPVTIGWYTEGGRLASQLLNQPTSGVLLWPGAVVDGSGNGVGWPGWEYQDENWVEVPDDRIPTMTLRVTINPSAEVVLTYPPASADCLTQPPGTLREVLPVPSMPSGLLWLLTMGLGLVGYSAMARRGAARRG